ncbi:hypothetical protein C6502_15920 [Candidatus Poribacteria bacterium]|nr:MAG: hypothetical protein C6502_15920 [Candidatus Poribacteria bacterium]
MFPIEIAFSDVNRNVLHFTWLATMVDLRINETLQIGVVRKPHLSRDESIYLFLEFTVVYVFCRNCRRIHMPIAPRENPKHETLSVQYRSSAVAATDIGLGVE